MDGRRSSTFLSLLTLALNELHQSAIRRIFIAEVARTAPANLDEYILACFSFFNDLLLRAPSTFFFGSQ